MILRADSKLPFLFPPDPFFFTPWFFPLFAQWFVCRSIRAAGTNSLPAVTCREWILFFLRHLHMRTLQLLLHTRVSNFFLRYWRAAAVPFDPVLPQGFLPRSLCLPSCSNFGPFSVDPTTASPGGDAEASVVFKPLKAIESLGKFTQ